jgi:hypothetical protein
MGTGFDTPLGGLALEMAYRNQQAKKKAAEQNAYEQSLVNKRLTPYGGDIGDYQDVWNRGYAGAMNAAQSQAQALQDYWVGLPELLTAAALENQSTGGGGSSAPSVMYPTTPAPVSVPYQPYTPFPATGPSPDVIDRPVFGTRANGQTVRARRLTPIVGRVGR